MYDQQSSITAAQAGWYPDPDGSGIRYWDGTEWSQALQYPALAPNVFAETEADAQAADIARYERMSGVLWIVIGVIQVLSVVLIIAGVWNIVAGVKRLSMVPVIQRRETRVPTMFEGVTGLVLIGLVNLVFGAVFGIVMVFVDLAIRQQVQDNRRIFNR